MDRRRKLEVHLIQAISLSNIFCLVLMANKDQAGLLNLKLIF